MRPIKFRAYHPDSGMKYFILNQIKGGIIYENPEQLERGKK